MQIDASATCKYLKHKNKKDADLAKACLSLRLVASCPDDVKILTAIHRLFMDGGTINVESPVTETKLKATMEGFRNHP